MTHDRAHEECHSACASAQIGDTLLAIQMTYLPYCTQQISLKVFCRHEAIVLFRLIRKQGIVVWQHLVSLVLGLTELSAETDGT
jgi:uncharacterized membrane protein